MPRKDDRAARPRALGPREACQELRDNAGTQFDPEVIDALLSMLDRYREAAAA
jgi:HD-GYP domain-containing protein (c-di-GMP phosphodiesterase class II)